MKEKKETERAPKKKTAKKSEKDPRRLANGNFAEGNTIGEGTRFKKGEKNGTSFEKGNTLSRKYKAEYADMLLCYFRDENVAFPTLEGFVEWVRTQTGEAISYNAASLWANTETNYAQRFKEIYTQAKAIQRDKLIFGGLTRKFDPTFARFLASSLHGMNEKSEQKVDANLKGEGTLNVNITFFEDGAK
jgi:hypothetical protein